jgi:hypothetical protein
MRKAILIEGPINSGKSRLARKIAKYSVSENAILVDGRTKILDCKYSFSECTVNTNFIIIDDLDLNINSIEEFYNFVTEGILVHKRGLNPFHINPEFIFCCNSSKKLTKSKKSISFKRRFDFFKLSNK